MPYIKQYDVYLKGDNNPITRLGQKDGQKLIILLCSNKRSEYVIFNDVCLAVNMISAVKEVPPLTELTSKGFEPRGECRELTEEEAKVQAVFDYVKGKGGERKEERPFLNI